MTDLDALASDIGLARATTRLEVDADLQLRVSTPAGASTTARVTGRGQRLRVEADRPRALLSAVDRADVARIADLLAEAGITVTVSGPDSLAATLGAGTHSRLGLLLTGSARVAPAPRAVARLAVTGRVPLAVAIAVFITLPVAAIARRRLRVAAGSTGRSG